MLPASKKAVQLGVKANGTILAEVWSLVIPFTFPHKGHSFCHLLPPFKNQLQEILQDMLSWWAFGKIPQCASASSWLSTLALVILYLSSWLLQLTPLPKVNNSWIQRGKPS